MRKASVVKGMKTDHTANTQKGMGDYYGTGIKQKMGRMRDGLGQRVVTPKKLKKPPKSLA